MEIFTQFFKCIFSSFFLPFPSGTLMTQMLNLLFYIYAHICLRLCSLCFVFSLFSLCCSESTISIILSSSSLIILLFSPFAVEPICLFILDIMFLSSKILFGSLYQLSHKSVLLHGVQSKRLHLKSSRKLWHTPYVWGSTPLMTPLSCKSLWLMTLPILASVKRRQPLLRGAYYGLDLMPTWHSYHIFWEATVSLLLGSCQNWNDPWRPCDDTTAWYFHLSVFQLGLH